MATTNNQLVKEGRHPKGRVETAMTVGRPTKYDPAYCQMVEEIMGQGYSLTAFAGHIGVSKETVYNWTREHPEFLGAVSRARPKRLAQLERQLLAGETGPKVTAFMFALKNADADEWRDKQSVESTVTVRHEDALKALG